MKSVYEYQILLQGAILNLSLSENCPVVACPLPFSFTSYWSNKSQDRAELMLPAHFDDATCDQSNTCNKVGKIVNPLVIL